MMSYWIHDCNGKLPLVSMMDEESNKEKPKITEASL